MGVGDLGPPQERYKIAKGFYSLINVLMTHSIKGTWSQPWLDPRDEKASRSCFVMPRGTSFFWSGSRARSSDSSEVNFWAPVTLTSN